MEAHPGAPEKTGVKIGLCHDDDKDFTRDDKILGEHFWIVDQITFSKYFTAWKHEKEQLERAIVPEESTESAPQEAEVEVVRIKRKSVESHVKDYFKIEKEYVLPGVKGKVGHIYKCILEPPPSGGHQELKITDSTSPLWKYIETHYPETYKSAKQLKQHTREREDATGSTVLLYEQNDPKKRHVDFRFLKMIQQESLAFQHGEKPAVRGFISALDPRYQPPTAETIGRLNLANLCVVKAKQTEHISRLRREQFQKVSLQVDMLTKNLTVFSSINMTFIVTESCNWKERNGGTDLWVDTLVIKANIFDLHQYELSDKTARNLLLDFETSRETMGLLYEDIAHIAPDGAANAVKFTEMLSDLSMQEIGKPVPSGVCNCHDIARAVLHCCGRHGTNDQSKNPELLKVILCFKKLATKFSVSPKLHASLIQHQLDLGVACALSTESPAVTRWNSIVTTHERANQLKPHFEAAMLAAGDIIIAIEDENGNPLGDRTVTINAISLLPNAISWEISRQLQALLKPIKSVTIIMQRLQHTPDQTWLRVKKISVWLKSPGLTLDVPNVVINSDAPLTYSKVPKARLHESIQRAIVILDEQLDQRFFIKGPSRSTLICLLLNLGVDLSMVLTASQIEIGRAHLRAELTYCNDLMQQREVFLRRDGHEVPVPVPQTNQKVSSASASSASAFDDDMDCFLLKPAASEISIRDLSATEAEIERFNSLSEANLSLGRIAGKFEPLVFYANKSIELLLPRYCAVARSFYAARNSEDTCERTFSALGRDLSDLRQNLDPVQAAASTMCADANDKYMITEEAVWSEYMTKTQAASSSSSSSSSATAVPLPSVAAAKP